jgi:hypothetical protein
MLRARQATVVSLGLVLDNGAAPVTDGAGNDILVP